MPIGEARNIPNPKMAWMAEQLRKYVNPEFRSGAEDWLNTTAKGQPTTAMQNVFAGLDMPGLPAGKVAGAAGILAGPLSRTADLKALAKAKKMAEKGIDRAKVWADTGWMKQGKDWVYEISDNMSMMLRKLKPDSSVPVGNVFRHDELFSAYPELEDDLVRSTPGRDHSYYFKLHPELPGMVDIGGSADARSGILHELGGHGVQDVEKFQGGGNTHMWTNPDAPRMLERLEEGTYPRSTQRRFGQAMDDPLTAYQSIPGEVNARTIQKRADMTPEERRAKPFWEDYDIPENKWYPEEELVMLEKMLRDISKK